MKNYSRIHFDQFDSSLKSLNSLPKSRRGKSSQFQTQKIKFSKLTKYFLTKDINQYTEDTPFSFRDKSIEESLEPVYNISFNDEIPFIEEPLYGFEPPGFNLKEYFKERKSRNFVRFTPHIFGKKLSPLRLPSQIPKDEQLLNPKHLKKAKRSHTALISFTGLNLNKKTFPIFISQISSFKFVEVLILIGCKLSTVAGIELPRLRICDLRNNLIKTKKGLQTFFRTSPNIEILDLKGNPICEDPNFRSITIAQLPRLSLLNGQEVGIDEKIDAIKKYAPKNIQKKIGDIKWDLVICSIPEIRTMPGWYPQNIVNLVLPNQGISSFHVGTFVSLQLLDLSGNEIVTLQGTGLEQCDKLLSLSMQNNKIGDLSNAVLSVLPFCPSLQHVNLSQNLIKDYRSQVIYACRNLRGTNRQPGLSTIDDKGVTSEEYIQSLYQAGAMNQLEIEKTKWMLLEFQQFGHFQLRGIDKFTKYIKAISFPSSNLGYSSVNKFNQIEVLVLQNNNLTEVKGIRKLKKLRWLDLSKNPNLNIIKTLQSLKEITTLEIAAFASDISTDIVSDGLKPKILKTTFSQSNQNEKTSLSASNTQYRGRVLSSLVPNNTKLTTIDTYAITVIERADAYLTQGMDSKMVEKYRFYLAVTLNATKDLKQIDEIDENEDENENENENQNQNENQDENENQFENQFGEYENNENDEKIKKQQSSVRSLQDIDDDFLEILGQSPTIRFPTNTWIEEINFSPSEVEPGKQYEISKVISLKHLCRLQLKYANFDGFENLEKLNLSNNQLENIETLGLVNLPKLQELDLSYNKIGNKVSELSALFDKLGVLEMVALRGNPCMKDSNSRQSILNGMTSIRQMKSRLRVIDSEITIGERVNAWKAQGVSEKQCEELRFQAVIFVRFKNKSELDLSNCELSEIDLSDEQFKDLEKLNLQTNLFVSLKKIKGLAGLTQLKVLDLRNNKLKKLDRVLELIGNFPSLLSVGFSGNKFEDYSAKNIISRIYQLRDPNYTLQYLDSKEISAEDIIQLINKTSLKEHKKKKSMKNLKIGGETYHMEMDDDKFRFQLNFNRRFRQYGVNVPKSEMLELDLSNCDLRKIDLQEFKSLKKLSLQNNHITDESFQNSNILQIAQLEELDISGNKLKDANKFSQVINILYNLKSLFIANNPMFGKDTPNERSKFLGKIPNVFQRPTLAFLNGKKITIRELTQALTLQNNESAERMRINMIAHRLELEPSGYTQLRLVDYEIKIFYDVRMFEDLTHLSLGYNKITNLNGQGLEYLHKLRVLDLRNNQISVFADAIQIIQEISTLRRLYLQNCTGRSDTQKPEAYIKDVCMTLRGLEMLDGISNPYPLQPEHWEELSKLMKITNGKIGNPHKITVLDLSNKKFASNLFEPVLSSLSVLPIKDLIMKDNPWENVPHYWFKIVYAIKSLQSLDGVAISIAQRDNAINHLARLNLIPKKPRTTQNVPNAKNPENSQNVTNQENAGKVKFEDQNNGKKKGDELLDNRDFVDKNMNKIVSGAGVVTGAMVTDTGDIDLDPNRYNSGAQEGIDLFQQGQEEVKTGMARFDSSIGTFDGIPGRFLTKGEIVISYLQILGVLITLINPDLWPDVFLRFSWITFPFSIDIDFLVVAFDIHVPFQFEYAKFVVFMALPIALYLVFLIQFNRERWKRWYHFNWKSTRAKIWISLVILIAITVIVGIFIDWNDFRDNDYKMTATQNGFILVFSGVFILLYFLSYLVIRNFRKHWDDDRHWFRYQKHKDRFILFALAVLYLPLARVILYNFKCDSTQSHLLPFPSYPCPRSIGDFKALQWISIVFGLLYIFGMPFFFLYLIRKSIKEIDTIYRVTEDLKEIKELKKKELKTEEHKKLIKQKKRKFKIRYSRVVKDYKCFQAYLYNSYKRSTCYYKPLQMLEKFLLILMTVAFTSEKILVAVVCGLMAVFTLIDLVVSPLSNSLESIMETSARISNTVNVFMGVLLAYSLWGINNASSGTVLLLSVLICLAIVLLIFIFEPILRCCKKKPSKTLSLDDSENRDEKPLKPIIQKEDSEDDLDKIDDDNNNNKIDYQKIDNNKIDNINDNNDEMMDLDDLDIQDDSRAHNQGQSFFIEDDFIQLENFDDFQDLDDLDQDENQIENQNQNQNQDENLYDFLENDDTQQDSAPKLNIPKHIKKQLSYSGTLSLNRKQVISTDFNVETLRMRQNLKHDLEKTITKSQVDQYLFDELRLESSDDN
ncbi:leucine rich repeat protein [Anaeramoeba ignava]|uniref:Leucine rich repeat protein n=1 Tax=Anaeramoeba ignava TaxID=1746090 RepID=A0A9Q0RIY2_ANAIG|nr:leucine rich repeat protein [Anaeramoeba ignava]